MTKRTKSRTTGAHPAGYRVFMSGFAGYARENGIKIHGGRGSFARKAGEVWKDLKAKPAWKDNLDIILPQYLEGVEGAEKITLSPEERRKAIVGDLGGNQFEWWNIKSLWGLWVENINVKPDKDRLMVIDSYGTSFELINDEASFNLYRIFKDLVDRGQIDEYSYVAIEDSEINENGGIDLVFRVVETTKYKKKIHDATTYDWDPKIKELYELKKEAIGKEGVTRLAKIKIRLPKTAKEEAERPVTKEDIEKIRLSSQRLQKINEAVSKLESQLERGLITKPEYRKYLNKIYKM